MANDKKLVDYSYDELIDYCAGHVLQRLIAGDLRGGISTTIHIANQWYKDIQARDAVEVKKQRRRR